jgi:hypothetical protein
VALPDDDQGWVTRLSQMHDFERPRMKLMDDEYELRAPRSYMHPEILRELGDRLAQVVIAWPLMVVDSLDERLDIEGFRLPNSDSADDDLWRVWQENNADEESQLAHVDALVMKRSYVAVGTNENDADTPLMTFESPLEVFADVDPRTRKVRAALRRWVDNHDSMVRSREEYATLYLPDQTVFYERDGSSGIALSGSAAWSETDRDEHGLGEVPVVPIVNRSRLADRWGRSEFAPILPLAHAANKIATDMMVAAEFVALPLRAIFGVGPEDLEDVSGNKLTALQAMLGRLLTMPDPDGTAKPFEFQSANLTNFHNTIDAIAKLVVSITGLPPHALGFTTSNPASADAIRSAEARWVKRAERKQRAFGGSHEQAMRLVRRFQEGSWDPKLRQLETIWRDASTPTVAQVADAATKKYAVGLVPLRQSREDLGYTEAQIARMEQADDAYAAALKIPTAAEMMELRAPRLSPAAAGEAPGSPRPGVPAVNGNTPATAAP